MKFCNFFDDKKRRMRTRDGKGDPRGGGYHKVPGKKIEGRRPASRKRAKGGGNFVEKKQFDWQNE